MAARMQTLTGTPMLTTSSLRTKSNGRTLTVMDGEIITSGRTPPWRTKKTLACSSPFVSSEVMLSLRLPASGPILTVMGGATTKAVPTALTTSHCELLNGMISMPMDLAITPWPVPISRTPAPRFPERRQPTMNSAALTPITTAYPTTLTRVLGTQKFRKALVAQRNAASPLIQTFSQTMAVIPPRF